MAEVRDRSCRSCAAIVTGSHCGDCGERWIPNGGEPAGAVLAAWLSDFFGTDGRVWRSLWAVLFRPGVLTVDYLRGRRRPWLRPLQLFIVANAMYFLALPWTDFAAYQSTLDRQLTRQYYSAQLIPVVQEHRLAAIAALEERGVAPELADDLFDEDLDRRFNATSEALSSTGLILFVPLVAIGVALVAPRAGLAAWMILAFHLATFQIVGINLVYGGLLHGLRTLVEPARAVLAGLPTEATAGLLVAAWSALALRRLEARPWWWAGAGGLLAATWLTLCLVAYRYVLFWATWWTIT